MPRAWLYAILILSLSTIEAGFSTLEGTYYCKCICFSNYTIQPIYRPSNPSKPCLTCTKQWCLDQKLAICADANIGDQNPDTASGKEGDVETRCFQRDSPRDQIIVTLFLLIVIGLLIGSAIKTRMEMMGIDSSSAWTSGRAWWERFLPSRQIDAFPLSQPSHSRSQAAYDRISS